MKQQRFKSKMAILFFKTILVLGCCFFFYQIIPLLILVHLRRNRNYKENTSNSGVNILALTTPGWILLTLEQEL